MTEEAKPAPASMPAPAAAPEVDNFPPALFPVLFSDGVSSIANGAGVVKFYMFRADPSFNSDGTVNLQRTMQVVMPAQAFVQTAIFFETVVKNMIRDGIITAEAVEEIRTSLGDNVGNGKD